MSLRCLAQSLLVLSVFSGTPATSALAQEPASRYIRKSTNADSVIVFVHGILGDGNTTWTNGTTSWPAMLTSDNAFGDASIFVYSYPTSLWATLSIDELAENMRLQLDANEVIRHRRISFLTHSMGGLVTRAYLLKNRDVASRTSFAYFFSTPTTGSHVASIATILSGNPQLGKMKPMNAEDYLADLLRQWLAAEFKIPSYCAYEKRSTYGQDIVAIQSASALCTKPLNPIDTNHIDIVKPKDANAIPYLAFKSAFANEMATSRPTAALLKQLEEVLNSLHQTQMRKDEELFPQITEYFREPSETNWRKVRETARTLLDEIKSAVRLSMAFDSQFYAQGEQILLIANGASDTVGRAYNQTFRVSRQHWNGKAFVLREIIESQDRPTNEQARSWAEGMKRQYDELNREIQRLIDLVRQRI